MTALRNPAYNLIMIINGIVALLNEQQRELHISPSLDGLHFPSLVSTEAHIVVEDVAVACIQFPQQRTSWAFARSEYRVWPDIVRKDSQEYLVFAVAVKQSVHLHEVMTDQPVTLCLRHRPCAVPFPLLQLVTPSDVWIVADGVPALEVLDDFHRQVESLQFCHSLLRRHCRRTEHQQDGYSQSCQCSLIVIACSQCLSLLSLWLPFPLRHCHC